MRTEGGFFRKFFQYIFVVHIFLTSVLAIFLTVRGIISAENTHHFQPKKWYLPILASTACAGIISFTFQAFLFSHPSRAIRAAFWFSPFLNCAVGVLLISIGTVGSLFMGIACLISAVIQFLYSCWVNHRIEHAIRVLSIAIAFPPPHATAMTLLSVVICTLYSSLLISGIGGATAEKSWLNNLFIFLILLSLVWTMQVIKNIQQVTVSHIKYVQFATGIVLDSKTIFLSTIRHSIGSICVGSILVPVVTIVRGSARAIILVSRDVDEFMFSCTGCSSGIASCLVVYGNRWGFVHVGVYNKGIVQASVDTWEIFRRIGMEELINSDLTSSLCFFYGVAGGAICTLLGGSWAFIIHKSYATELSIYAFLIGYLMTRVTMAPAQASISAYYVAYAENPQSQRFDTTIPAYIQQLQREETARKERSYFHSIYLWWK